MQRNAEAVGDRRADTKTSSLETLVLWMPIIDIQSLLDDWRQRGATDRSSAFETLSFMQGTCFVAVRR
jgi:hypothetical protein